MTARERIGRIFAGEKVDAVPVMHIGFSSEVASRLLGHEAYVGGGVQQYREACALWQGECSHSQFVHRSLEDAVALGLRLNHDVIRCSYWRLPQKPTDRLDEYTFVYGSGEASEMRTVRRYDPLTELFEPIQTLSPISLQEQVVHAEQAAEQEILPEARFRDYLAAKALLGDHPIRVDAAKMSVPLDDKWLEAMITEPELVSRLLKAQCRRGLAEIRALHSLGGELVFGGGDMASQQGPLYSPKAFERFVLPNLAPLVEECKRLDMKYLFCSDGNLWPVANLLFKEAGVHGYYEIDADAGMDLGLLRHRYPDLVLFGNISSSLLHKGDPNTIEMKTRACCELARDMGRIVVGCSNQVVYGTPEPNLQAMLRVIEEYR